MEKKNKGKIAIYQNPEKGVELKVRLEKETIWLDAHQMALVFDVNRPAIVKHIRNIYRTGELDRDSTCSILEQVAADGKVRKMNFYNLDVIISVGYRVNSKQATQFRIWATRIIKDYITKGYAINQKRLKETQKRFEELKNIVSFLSDKAEKGYFVNRPNEILTLISDYAKTLRILEQYDKKKLEKPKGKRAKTILALKECYGIITQLKNELIDRKEASNLFGLDTGGKFEGVIKALYQTFGGRELYKTIEEKAAHLLYLTIKDHPFVDGNKRIGSFLFIYFLDRNNYLYRRTGERKINDNALTALSLLIAESNPKEKDILIKIIINLLKD